MLNKMGKVVLKLDVSSSSEESDEDSGDQDKTSKDSIKAEDQEEMVNKGREEVKDKKHSSDKKYTNEEEDAILVIQAGARGYVTRKEIAKSQEEKRKTEISAKTTQPKQNPKRLHSKQDSEDYDSGTSMSSQNSIIRLEKSNEPIPIVNGVLKVSSKDNSDINIIRDNNDVEHDAENSESLSDSLKSTMETSDYVTSSSDNSMSAPIRAKKTPFSLLKRFVNLMSASNVRKHKVGVGSETKDIKHSKSTNDISSKEVVEENGIGSAGEDSSKSTSKPKKLSKRLSKSRNSVASEPSSTTSNVSKSSARSTKLSKSSKVSPSSPEVIQPTA
jgi:hypothetical protein